MTATPRDVLAAKITKACVWYEINKPGTSARLVFMASPKLIAKAIGTDYTPGQTEFVYRGHVIASLRSE